MSWAADRASLEGTSPGPSTATSSARSRVRPEPSGTLSAAPGDGSAPGSPGVAPWGVVGNTAVSAGDASIAAAWTAPADDGGFPVGNYELELNDQTADSNRYIDAGAELTEDIAGLTNGHTYRLRIRAANANGAGPWSDWSASATPATTPGAPLEPTISVTAVNDPALISGDTSHSGNEGDTATGDLDATDVDGLTDGSYFGISAQGTHGSASINALTGAWRYSAGHPDWFGSDSFEVTVTDDLGGTTTQAVNVALANVDDPAVISGAAAGTVQVDRNETASGSLSISDVDPADNPSFPDVAAMAGDAGYGTFAMSGGTWTYALNHSHTAVQALRAGESLSDSHTFVASDGSARAVTIVIDGPVAVDVVPVTEDSPAESEPQPAPEVDEEPPVAEQPPESTAPEDLADQLLELAFLPRLDALALVERDGEFQPSADRVDVLVQFVAVERHAGFQPQRVAGAKSGGRNAGGDERRRPLAPERWRVEAESLERRFERLGRATPTTTPRMPPRRFS